MQQAHTEQLRVISYSGDLKTFIRKLADELNLNVVFDRTSFAQPRQIDLNLKERNYRRRRLTTFFCRKDCSFRS